MCGTVICSVYTLSQVMSLERLVDGGRADDTRGAALDDHVLPGLPLHDLLWAVIVEQTLKASPENAEKLQRQRLFEVLEGEAKGEMLIDDLIDQCFWLREDR